jgi:hypothetical protein
VGCQIVYLDAVAVVGRRLLGCFALRCLCGVFVLEHKSLEDLQECLTDLTDYRDETFEQIEFTYQEFLVKRHYDLATTQRFWESGGLPQLICKTHDNYLGLLNRVHYLTTWH